jgi:DNA replication protein DnaC
MSINTALEQLHALHLMGMASGLEQQLHQSTYASLPFEQRLVMLLASESNYRNNLRYTRLLKAARLKVNAEPEQIDFKKDRGLDRELVANLLTCDWISKGQNLVMTGKTGTGKTWLSCALAVQAARKGLTVQYRRVPRMLEDMAIAQEDGSILKIRNQLSKSQLLILDDFGLVALNDRGKANLLELLDDRVGSSSTIVLGQMPTKEWHGYINDPALADAILDRLVHSSHKITLRGESMRKLTSSVSESLQPLVLTP